MFNNQLSIQYDQRTIPFTVMIYITDIDENQFHIENLYTRYPIVARALGLAAAYAECAREQRHLAYNLKTGRYFKF